MVRRAVIQRLGDMMPHARILVCVRNPVDRFLSEYVGVRIVRMCKGAEPVQPVLQISSLRKSRSMLLLLLLMLSLPLPDFTPVSPSHDAEQDSHVR
jgi:hypothetical protein